MTATWRFVLILLAVILFVILALIGGQVFTDTPPEAKTIWLLLGFGLASGFAALITPPRP